jgi:hypothetical protein
MRKVDQTVTRARKDVRAAIVKRAEVVACTLSSAGGDLLALLAKGPLFDVLIVDEVRFYFLMTLSFLMTS